MFGTKLRRLPWSISPVIRQQMTITTNSNNGNHDKHLTKSTNGNSTNEYAPRIEKIIRDKNLANITVTSFYCQSAIEQCAAKVFRFIIFN